MDRFARPYPTEDLKLSRSVILWSQGTAKESRFRKVRVLCECGNDRFIAVGDINKAIKKHGDYSGLCQKCNRRELYQKLGSKRCEDHGRYKGRRRFDKKTGYWFVGLYPGDDMYEYGRNTGRHGHVKYILEHRYVIMRHLGRPLHTWEHVHHRNGIKTDNRLENLEVVDPKSHATITQLQHENIRLRNEIDRLRGCLGLEPNPQAWSIPPKRRSRAKAKVNGETSTHLHHSSFLPGHGQPGPSHAIASGQELVLHRGPDGYTLCFDTSPTSCP